MEFNDDTPTMNASTIANTIGVDIKQVRMLVKAEMIHPVKVGKAILFSKNDATEASKILKYCETVEELKGFNYILQMKDIDGDVDAAIELLEDAKAKKVKKEEEE